MNGPQAMMERLVMAAQQVHTKNFRRMAEGQYELKLSPPVDVRDVAVMAMVDKSSGCKAVVSFMEKGSQPHIIDGLKLDVFSLISGKPKDCDSVVVLVIPILSYATIMDEHGAEA